MAGKFVDLNEAAKMLAVSAEELIEMRSKGDIFGYRDGASWKFKTEEVERVIRDRGAEGRGGDSAVLAASDEEFENIITGLSSKILAEKAQEESGSVLVSEQELGVSATGHSTIIGKGEKEIAASDSDLRLADDSSKDILGGGSDKLLEAPGSRLQPPSGSDVLHVADIKPASGSGTGDMPLPKPGSTGAMAALEVGVSEEDDLEIGSSDSALDEEIRPKTGSGKGSDITLGSGDSGINLKPGDSGISLEEEPLDLGGSGLESLELPEDEEVIALGGEADQDAATQLKADNEFLLSAGETLQEDESDSGSQVIALEDSESFDQDAATMLKAEPAAALEEEGFQPVPAEAAMVGMPAMAAGQPVYVPVSAVEAPYSVWNVISLSVVALLLATCGMMMMDVMLNMWSFNEPGSLSTGLADGIAAIIPK